MIFDEIDFDENYTLCYWLFMDEYHPDQTDTLIKNPSSNHKTSFCACFYSETTVYDWPHIWESLVQIDCIFVHSRAIMYLRAKPEDQQIYEGWNTCSSIICLRVTFFLSPPIDNQKYRLFCKTILKFNIIKRPSFLFNGEVVWQAF